MAGKGMIGWNCLDEGNGILCSRDSKYEVLRWKQLYVFWEKQESQTDWSAVRQEGRSEGGAQ